MTADVIPLTRWMNIAPVDQSIAARNGKGATRIAERNIIPTSRHFTPYRLRFFVSGIDDGLKTSRLKVRVE